MTGNKNPKSCLAIVGITVLTLLVAGIFCRYAFLRSNAIALEIPNPPGGEVKTSRYWPGFLASYHVWDRHYQIPAATFDSEEDVESYFDNWLTGHDWVDTADSDGDFITPSYCLSGKRVSQADIERSLVAVYTTQEWLDRPPMKAPLVACLIIEPEVPDGYYLVRLFTLHPTSLHELNM